MKAMPVAVQQPLRRLARRLAIGIFLEVWPRWAVASLLLTGIVVLICRLFVPAAAPRLAWLWLAPGLAALPALVTCRRRAYRPDEVVALADSLTGGHGTLMALHETNDLAWRESSLAALAARGGSITIPVPRLRPWRQLALLPAALAFMAAAFWLPQRLPQATNTILADDIADDLTATLAELKQQELITPVEEKRLDEEITRIRRGAEERVDSSSWEAADSLRDTMIAGVSEKVDAVKWAEESLARYAAAASQGGVGVDAEAMSAAQRAELTAALQRLAQHGLLTGAPLDLQKMLASGKLPADAASLRALTDALSKHLANTKGRIAGLRQPGKFGRFDPAEFAVGRDGQPPDGRGRPGRGGVNRGRGDAELTWGKESSPIDRFKPATLPPGAARSPDDWAPIAELPGTPEVAPELSGPAADRQYAAVAGQSAWRRTLAPRHQSAVKNYFAK